MTYKNRKERGFTLIELLVVIGIIAALAAVVIPNVASFMGRGETEANNAELQNVQSAMDLYMAENALSVVPDNDNDGVNAAISDFDTAATPPVVLYPDYLRLNPTKCGYWWDATGLVEQDACP